MASGRPGEPVADVAEGAGVGGGVRARRAADGRLVDVDDLVEELDAVERVEGLGRVAAAVEPARGGLLDGLDQQRGLAAAGDAGHAGEAAERDRRRDVLEIVAARAAHDELAALVELAPLGRERDGALAGEILAGEALRMRHDLGRRSFRDDLAAMHARGRADVDDVVGLQDRVLVMFDDNHGIAEVAQVPERHEQPRVVALMQADGWLVEHIEHAGQPRADLRGEPDALAFAAGERAGIAATAPGNRGRRR